MSKKTVLAISLVAVVLVSSWMNGHEGSNSKSRSKESNDESRYTYSANYEPTEDVCPLCNGAGIITCSICHGTGENSGYQNLQGVAKSFAKPYCETCNGNGYITCGRCHGSGVD